MHTIVYTYTPYNHTGICTCRLQVLHNSLHHKKVMTLDQGKHQTRRKFSVSQSSHFFRFCGSIHIESFADPFQFYKKVLQHLLRQTTDQIFLAERIANVNLEGFVTRICDLDWFSPEVSFASEEQTSLFYDFYIVKMSS